MFLIIMQLFYDSLEIHSVYIGSLFYLTTIGCPHSQQPTRAAIQQRDVAE